MHPSDRFAAASVCCEELVLLVGGHSAPVVCDHPPVNAQVFYSLPLHAELNTGGALVECIYQGLKKPIGTYRGRTDVSTDRGRG